MKNKKQVGKALGRVPSGLFVVTTKFQDKEDAVLASWVNQCSFDPPTVNVSLGKMRNARLLIDSKGNMYLFSQLEKVKRIKKPLSRKIEFYDEIKIETKLKNLWNNSIWLDSVSCSIHYKNLLTKKK